MRTYYQLLGVEEDANEAAIVNAYREAMKRFHPDLHPGDASAAKQARQLNRAREVLCDPLVRKKYDAYLERVRKKGASPGVVSEGDSSSRKEASTSVGGQGFASSGKEFRANAGRRRRSKAGRQMLSVLGAILGAFLGLAVGVAFVWHAWGLDPLGVRESEYPWLLGEPRDIGGAGDIHGIETWDAGERQASVLETEVLTEDMAGGQPGDASGVRPTVVEEPKDESEAVVAIAAFSNGSKKTKFLVPPDVERVEIGFIGEDGVIANLPRSYPGYKGILKIDGKVIVAFARKYKWKGDGQWYSLSFAHDGTELNSRRPDTMTNRWYDITEFVRPGVECEIEYRHGQRSSQGVCLRLHSNGDVATNSKPESGSD